MAMKTVTKRIMDGNTLKGFEVLAVFNREERRVASADANPTKVEHKCGGVIHKLHETTWGRWYVCGKCCADLSAKMDLREQRKDDRPRRRRGR